MADPFIGEIKMFAGGFAPRGYALCHGQLLPISQNQALFSLLGTTYGGDGRVTFALPDMRGRAPVHQVQGPGLTARTMGQQVGTETVTLSNVQIPAHRHAQSASLNAATAASGPSGAPGASATTPFYGSAVPTIAMSPLAIGAAGSGQPHENMAPVMVLNFIIALVGIFPSRS